MLSRFYYSSTIKDFLPQSPNEIIGILALKNEFSLEDTQRYAWYEEIELLKKQLTNQIGHLYFEYAIPRMGKRIDVVCIIGGVLFLLEFKVGENKYPSYAIDQVMDYALDLKNFHETTHDLAVVPILISTGANADLKPIIDFVPYKDNIYKPIRTNGENLKQIIELFSEVTNNQTINALSWQDGSYKPTPTIVEAAMALYRRHNVENITRNEADATNLHLTTHTVDDIIKQSKEKSRKSICFITGVPGAGKTLVGLDVATKHINKDNEMYSVFLSGNGPLVDVLREALALDKVEHETSCGNKLKLSTARSEVKMFIQNVHHFRDDSLKNLSIPPIEHVALFDEAQRAWNEEKTTDFMKRKKGIPNFNQSESEFLISCMDRHKDWAVIVCLVGGGQEIHVGEAGIAEWLRAIDKSFPHWDVYISPQLNDAEYKAQDQINLSYNITNIKYLQEMHLAVSMRSFRAEHLSGLVKNVLDFDEVDARKTLDELRDKYPIKITRDLGKAKTWLREKARGSERYGMVVSSQASRLKPLAVDVRFNINPIHWFLKDKQDTRSSYFLEDVATEFQIQGLELDWTCVIWDADFRYTPNGWNFKSFKGSSWYNINKPENQQYLINAYRVLLTRARQGMVIVVPEGDKSDHTRLPEFYDPTYNYLNGIGFDIL